MTKETAGPDRQTDGAAGSGVAERSWAARDVIRRITGRKQAEEALRASEERYRDLVRNINDVIFEIDTGGRITFISPAIEAATGHSPAEMIGRSFTEFLHPVDLPATINKAQKRLSGDREPNEYRLLTKSGEARWVQSLGRPILEGDRVVGFHGVLTDITERKRAEEALRQSEEGYRGLTDSITDVFFAMDRDLRYTYWNKASENLTGIPAGDAIGKSLYDLFPEVKGTETDRLYHEVLTNAQPRSFVNEYQRGGKDFSFEISAYPSATGLSVFVKDITGRKRAEEALRERTHDLGERVKELNCLYGIARLVEEPDISLEEIVRRTVDLIPGSWQYPEVTCARIIFEGQEFRTDNFSEAPWRQAADIILGGKRAGTVEVCYLEERPESDEGPFLKEERSLVVAIAQRLGRITERKRAEEALRASEAKYSTVVRQANDGVIIAQDDVFKFVNKAYADLTGYSVDELTGMDFMDTIPPEDRASVAERYEKRLKGEPPSSPYEAKLLCKDGTTKDVEFSAASIEYEGRPAAMGIVRDITERKRAEEALRESEKKYRNLVENVNDVIYEADVSGRITYISPVIEQRSGYTLAEIMGRPATEFVHPDDVASIMEGLQRNLSGNPEPNEYRLLSKSGEIHWVRSFSRPIFERDRVIGLRGVATDITERKRAEEEIRKFKTISDRAGYGSAMSDLEGNLIYMNDAFARMHGYAPEELIGKNLSVLHNEEQMEKVERLKSCLQEEGKYVAEEVWHKRKDNTVFPTLMNGTLISDDEGTPLYMAATAVDITERKRADEALRESEEKYRNLVDYSNDMLIAADQAGNWTFLSPAVKRILGYEPGEMLGRPAFDFMFPEDIASTREAHESVVREGRHFWEYENRYVRKDGTVVTLAWNVVALRDDQGNIIGTQGVGRDITERKRADEALRAAREELEGKVERQMLRRNPYGLTFRELTVLHLVGVGRSDKEIGIELSISPLTAQKHISNILGKMEASSRTEAGVRAVRERLLD